MYVPVEQGGNCQEKTQQGGSRHHHQAPLHVI